MSINPQTDSLVSAKETPAKVQKWTRSKTRLSHSTLHRWFTVGVAGVVLESCLISGVRYTSDEALTKFFNETAKAKNRQHRNRSAKPKKVDRRKEIAELGI